MRSFRIPFIASLILTFCFCFAERASSQELNAQNPCAKSCVLEADCKIGGVCVGNTCQYKEHFCTAERWAANDRGEVTNCNAYICEEATGFCRRTATSPIHCTLGYVFDGTSNCLPSIQCDIADPTCQKLTEQWKIARDNYEKRTPSPVLPPLTCTACKQSSECAKKDQMCWNGLCVRGDSHCVLDSMGDWGSMSPAGVLTSCGALACDSSAGLCLQSCQSQLDCRQGKACVVGNCL